MTSQHISCFTYTHWCMFVELEPGKMPFKTFSYNCSSHQGPEGIHYKFFRSSSLHWLVIQNVLSFQIPLFPSKPELCTASIFAFLLFQVLGGPMCSFIFTFSLYQFFCHYMEEKASLGLCFHTSSLLAFQKLKNP